MQDTTEIHQHHDTLDVSTQNTADSATEAPIPVHGVLIGILSALNDQGQPCVSYDGNLGILPVLARATTALGADAVGKQVALLFENGDINKPIIVGVMQVPLTSPPATTSLEASSILPSTTELIVDGRRIDLQASEQIVLRCGKSSITMTSAGKVIIRGTYVSSKSSGANRIKGGSVQIN